MERKLLAEFIGTFTLIAVGVGSILMDAGLAAVALAHGLAIAVMVCAMAHVSGAHFNPAVTLAMLVTKNVDIMTAVKYWVAQFAGAIAGALAISWLFPNVSGHVAGVPALGEGVTMGMGLGIEALLTFFLVWVIYGIAVDQGATFGSLAGLPIGFTISACILMAGPLTGVAINPARWLGPALVGGQWDDSIVWIAGPLLGAVVAALLYTMVMSPTEKAAA